MTCNALTTAGRSRSIAVALPIDLSSYKYLVAKYNNGSIMTVNVRGVNRDAYITVARWLDGGSSHYMCVAVSSQKANFSTNRIGDAFGQSVLSSGALTIQEVYLVPFEYKYLYKDGKQNVAWDNSGVYRQDNGWTSDGGATLNPNNMTIQYCVAPSHNRAIVTDSVVDFSQYSILKIASVYSGTEHIKTVDISSIQSSGYVAIRMYYNGSNQYFGVTLSASKDYFNSTNNRIIDAVDTTSATQVTVTRVWLEK